jgi:hypothetical protein
MADLIVSIWVVLLGAMFAHYLIQERATTKSQESKK